MSAPHSPSPQTVRSSSPLIPITIVIAMALALASCSGGGSGPEATASLSATSGSAVDDSFEASPLAAVATDGELRFLTADGITLAGRVFGTGTVGVVMAHESGGTSDRWASLAPAMAGEGYRVLAFDLRGHGGSEGEPGQHLAEDVLAAVAYLRDESLSRVVVMGVGDAGVGALEAAIQSPNVIGVVAIGPDSSDTDDGRLAAFEGLQTPTLLFASEDDAEPARELAELLDDRDLTLYDVDLPEGDLLAGAIGPDLWKRLAAFVQSTGR